MNFEIDDQAGVAIDVFSLHVQQKHGGKIDKSCGFCNLFLPNPLAPPPTYEFIILDVTENKDEI